MKKLQQAGFNIFGYFAGGFGLAVAAKNFVKAIDGKIPYALKNIPNNFQIKEETEFSEEPLKYFINLYFINADAIKSLRNKHQSLIKKETYEIGIWFWELETFPGYLRSAFNVLDEIWVFSDYIYENLKDESPIPVRRVPFPWFNNNDETFSQKEKVFTFLNVFDYRSDFYRKNPIGAIQAFQKAFPENENVSLIIKSINAHEFKQNHKSIQQFAARDMRIKVIDERITRPEMEKLFNNSNCFISLHRAEGLGLNILEAADKLKPLIVSKYGGCTDFLSVDNCECITFEKVKVRAATEFLNAENALWADPSLEEAVQAMLSVYNNYSLYEYKTKTQKKYQTKCLDPQKTLIWIEEWLKNHKAQPRFKKNYHLSTVIKQNISRTNTKRVLLMGTAPFERVKEIYSELAAMNFSRLDYFGRDIDIDFTNQYIYEKNGMFNLAQIDKGIIEKIRNTQYDVLIVPLMNYYGFGYENIREIAECFKPSMVVALGKENDWFYW